MGKIASSSAKMSGENSFFGDNSGEISYFPPIQTPFFFACGGPIYLVKSIFLDFKSEKISACGEPKFGEINFDRGKIAFSEIMLGKIAVLGKIALFPN